MITRYRLLVASLLGAAIAAGAWVQPVAAEKSFSLPSVDTTVTVNPDASMDIIEVVTYDFNGGPFNFGIRSFESDRDKVVDFTATDLLGTLEVIPPSQSISGEWEWALRQPTSNTIEVFVLTYHVVDALQVGDDVADLNWKFIGSDHPGVGTMTITVDFPPGIPPTVNGQTLDTDTTVLRGFAHGPSNGNLTVQQSRMIATVTDVPAEQFVELRAAVPATAFTAPSDGTTKLAGILKQEADLQQGIDDLKSKRRLGWIVTPILALGGLIGGGALWIMGGRERKSQEVLGEYWREPLDDPPAIAISTLKRGAAPVGTVFAGTLIDLAQRGYLRISGERVEKLGPDKTVHTYHWMGKPLDADLRPYERKLLEMVFRGGTKTTSEELTTWAGKHQSKAQSLLKSITKGVAADFTARKYEGAPRGKYLGLLLGLGAVLAIGGWIVTAALHNGIGWVAIVLAPLLVVIGFRVLSNRTQAGAEAAAKANGLKEFLRDFSQLEDAPVGHLILWERYLVYAVALGVSTELIKGLAARVPQVMNDPGFGIWYVGPFGHFDGFDQVINTGNATVSAATPKSSSGGGGGFSGGSSGGGGGGGFGAR